MQNANFFGLSTPCNEFGEGESLFLLRFFAGTSVVAFRWQKRTCPLFKRKNAKNVPEYETEQNLRQKRNHLSFSDMMKDPFYALTRACAVEH